MRYCHDDSSVISPGGDLSNRDNGPGKPKPPHNAFGSPVTLHPQPLEGYIQIKSWDEGCGPLARWWRGCWRSIDNCSDTRMNQGRTTTTVHVVLVLLLSRVTLCRWHSFVPRWNGLASLNRGFETVQIQLSPQVEIMWLRVNADKLFYLVELSFDRSVKYPEPPPCLMLWRTEQDPPFNIV